MAWPQLEATVAAREATIAEQHAELVILREAKAKGAARIEELEGRMRASRVPPPPLLGGEGGFV